MCAGQGVQLPSMACCGSAFHIGMLAAEGYKQAICWPTGLLCVLVPLGFMGRTLQWSLVRRLVDPAAKWLRFSLVQLNRAFLRWIRAASALQP